MVIPCRDAAATIAQTIRSVLAQTLPPAEVIVIDDGSTDRSATLAAGFRPKVRVIAGGGKGANAARILGAQAAGGEALMFLDADDLLSPNALEELARALDSRPDGIACCSWRRLVSEGRTWRAYPPSCARRGLLEDPLSAWLSGWHHPPCSVLWSRTAFERSGGWGPEVQVNQDGDLMIRALAAGAPLVVTDRAVAYYRRPPAGRTSLSVGPPDRGRALAKLATLRRVRLALERRSRIDRFRPALARAFLEAGRSVARHPDLHRACREEARAVCAPEWRREVAGLARSIDVAAGRIARRAALAVRRKTPSVAPSAPIAATPWRLPSRSPRVSVIIPTYNRAPTLKRAIQSVLAQTYADFELLVVDDGSTDQTEDLVRRIGDPRIRFIAQPRNMGVAAARNRGLAESRGALIAFLDSDDLWAPRKLARQVALFERSPLRVGLVYTGVETMDEAGVRSVDTPRLRGDAFTALLHGNAIHGGGSNVMIRREAAEAAGGFDESLPAIEDYEYWLRIARFFHIDFAPETLARIHDEHSGEEARARSRRSLQFENNAEARRRLHATYRYDMRQAGAEHAFLVSSIRRHVNDREGSMEAVRTLALQAIAARPLDPTAYAWLALSFAPRNALPRLRQAAARAAHAARSRRPQARPA